MTYLIYEDEDLIDVIEFDSEDELKKYKKLNPTHTLQPDEELMADFQTLEEIRIEEEENTDEIEDETDNLPW